MITKIDIILIVIICTLLFACGLFIGSNFDIQDLYGRIYYGITPCDGIEILNSSGFYDGVELLKDLQNYSIRNGALTPRDLIAGKPSDCETLARATSCLAELKNKDYKYYYRCHVGIKIKEYDNWYEIT